MIRKLNVGSRMSYKAIIFDYGGVITRGGAGDDIPARIASNLNIPLEEAIAMFRHNRDRYITGKINEDEFWGLIEKEHGQKIVSSARTVWNNWRDMKPDPRMIKLVKELKSKGYLVGLLSNVIPNTQLEISNHQIYDLFNPCLLSCEIGLAKPDHKMYEELLKSLPNCRPKEVVFIDDSERCLVPAREIGVHTILAKSTSQVINDLHTLLEY